MKTDLIFKEESYRIMGACFEVYKKKTLKQTYEPDFLCFNEIILEIKTVKTITDEHRAQIINYLKSTNKNLGLLVNFGHYARIEHERFVYQKLLTAKHVK
jgi:GxxExxY protein